ncbi:hypothetical protein Tco_0429150 [Tanacetum coccineum]
MKVFPLSLADDARQWWINDGEGKITTWEELVEKFFCKFYPESHDGKDEMLDEGDNWGIYPLEFISRVNLSFKNHMKVDGRTKKRKEDKKNDEQPNKRVCKAEKFEAIKYSLGSNEEYIAIRRCEYNAWEKSEDIIMEYLVKISKKARILELKRRNMKITVLTSYTPYPSRKIRCICARTSLKTTKDQGLIRRIQRSLYAVFKLW